MDEWVTFLNARLDEDEAVAKDKRYVWPTDFEVTLNPARVLREVEAKRAILAEHTRNPEAAYGQRGHMCGSDGYSRNDCRTLRILAAIYSDHPDYPGGR